MRMERKAKPRNEWYMKRYNEAPNEYNGIKYSPISSNEKSIRIWEGFHLFISSEIYARKRVVKKEYITYEWTQCTMKEAHIVHHGLWQRAIYHTYLAMQKYTYQVANNSSIDFQWEWKWIPMAALCPWLIWNKYIFFFGIHKNICAPSVLAWKSNVIALEYNTDWTYERHSYVFEYWDW